MNRRWILLLALCWQGPVGCTGESPVPPPVRTGLEVVQSSGFASLRGKRVGVVVNPTSVDRSLRSLIDCLAAAPGVQLAAIFGPEHGVAGAAAAGEQVAGSRDPVRAVPVHSLYGETRRPTRAMLEGLDAIVFDLQDVGARPYTYLSTLREVLGAAGDQGIKVIVLDRPNPLGGEVIEGPVLESGRESFVGCHTIPLRHGLTVGELALMLQGEIPLQVDLTVIPAEGWTRDRTASRTGLLWIPPSPNLPDSENAVHYAGFVLIEGTTLSEGRGTPLPFRWVGAPWLDAPALVHRLQGRGVPGCLFRAQDATPSASKHVGLLCHGIQVHLTDERAYSALRAVLEVLSCVRALHPDQVLFRPAELDRLAGTSHLREALEAGTDPGVILAGWQGGLDAFRARRERYLLYR